MAEHGYLVTREMIDAYASALRDTDGSGEVRIRAGISAVLAIVGRDAPARILGFAWHDYGLDEVEDAEPDYAAHLARRILTGRERP